MPLFADPPGWTIWDMTRVYTRATFGDVDVALVSFWSVPVLARSRRWALSPTWPQPFAFTMTGVASTIVFAFPAKGILQPWQYAATMFTLPVPATGL